MFTGPVMVDPTSGPDINVPLNFNHIMTLLEFRMSTTLVGNLTVKSITLQATDGSFAPVDVFAMAGEFDPRTGVVTPLATTLQDEIVITYDKTVAYKSTYPNPAYNAPVRTWTSFGVIVPQIAHIAGGNIEAVIEFHYKHTDEYGDEDYDDDELFNDNQSHITIPFNSLLTSGSTQGFLQGYRYIFNIEIDNFIKYFGYPIVEPWVNENDGTDDIIHDIVF
jgi:hypothetical protein